MISVPFLSIRALRVFHSFISPIFWGADGSGVGLGGSGVVGALYCESPALMLCLDCSRPFVPPSSTIGSDAGNAAIMIDRVDYGAYFAAIAEPVGLVCELLSLFLCWVT